MPSGSEQPRKYKVVASFRFVAMHHWPDAPEAHAYLRALHRHEFHVRAWVAVDAASSEAGDRVVEICRLKEDGRRLAELAASSSLTRSWSCEQWASYLLVELGACDVEVLEDGENGAVVSLA